MTTKSKKLPRLEFQVNEFPGCCGIGVVNYFEEAYSRTDWFSGKRKQLNHPFKTPHEQAQAAYKEILDRTWSDVDEWDNYSYLQIALVSHYGPASDKAGKAQLPELQELLVKEGWTINMVFINPNHGNEITVFSKYFPERNARVEHTEEEDAF